MAHVELNVTSGEPCENGPRRRDGAYICNVHNLLGGNIKRTRLMMGSSNPYDEPVSDLVHELRGRVRETYKFLGGRELPIQSFIGLSIVRVCVRGEHGDGDVTTPRAERVASVVFAKNPEALVEIELHRLAQMRSISEAGIGSARRAGGKGMADVNPLLHLPITPAEKDFAITHAMPAFPATGKARDPHVALHTLPDGSRFVEDIVPRDAISG